MPDYSKGRIYTIRCRSNDKLIYVGSTTQSLSVRFAGHKKDKKITLYRYINNPENNTTWVDWYIELYENCPCNSKEELTKRENEVIRDIATINKQGYYIDRKDYHIQNRDAILARRKEWGETRRDELNTKQKEYYKIHRDEISAQKKEYREQNKDKISAKDKDYKDKNKDKILAQAKEYRERKKMESLGEK